MAYTIIDSVKKSVFIQQTYEKIEEAEARLVTLKAKFGTRYQFEIIEIEEAKAPVETKASTTKGGKQSS